MTAAAKVFDCVVVGGGAAGAATALGLARAGWQVAVIERNPRPAFGPKSPVTRVATLNAASMQLLDHLGVRDRVLARRGHAFHRMEVWDARGPALIRFDADALGVPALGWTVELLALEASLWEGLDDAGAVLRGETSWRALDWRPDRVDLHLHGGEVLGTRLLIAADGGDSPLRARAGIPLRRHDYHACGVVATVGTELPHEDTAWQRFDGDQIVAFLPLADGRCSIVWSLPDYLGGELLKVDDEAFAAALQVAIGGRLGAVTSVSPRQAFALVGRQAREYSRGRLALVGDAAHTIHPLAGQGLNLGLADVQALLDVLPNPGVSDDPADREVLRAYTRSRRLDNELMLRSMEGLRWLFGSRLPVLAALRGAGVRQVDRRDPLKRFFALRALGI